MKRYFILIVAALMACHCAYAQGKTETAADGDTNSESKAVEFMRSAGTLMKTEYFNETSIKMSLSTEVLILTDIVNGAKMGCVKISHYDNLYGSGNTYSGILDYEEIDACIKSLTYIKDAMLPTTPEVYTEIEYLTSDRMKFRAYYSPDSESWKAYVYTKGYTSRSADFFNATNLDKLIAVLTEAKQLIEDKVK